MNWVLLDEQFKFVQSGSGAQQVGNDQEFKLHTATSNITKNGYLYVFVSNETPNINVFFDNLQVSHLKGALLEESHYYPFGTEMSAISSHSLPSYVLNRYKANGGAEYGDGEWSNGGGLEMYETFYRSYNAQTGRFMQGDPMMEVSMESYVFGRNNPVSFTDFFGDLETAEYKTLKEIVIKKYSFSNTAENISNWVDLLLANPEFGSGGDWSFLGDFSGGGGGGGGKGKGKGNTRRPGKQTDRDPEKKNPKYPSQFWEWYHKPQNTKDYKLPGQPDPNIDEVFKDWWDLGRPKFSPQPIPTQPSAADQIMNTTAKVGTVVVVGIVVWEVVKWGVAGLAAVPTGGGSLILAGATP